MTTVYAIRPPAAKNRQILKSEISRSGVEWQKYQKQNALPTLKSMKSEQIAETAHALNVPHADALVLASEVTMPTAETDTAFDGPEQMPTAEERFPETETDDGFSAEMIAAHDLDGETEEEETLTPTEELEDAANEMAEMATETEEDVKPDPETRAYEILCTPHNELAGVIADLIREADKPPVEIETIVEKTVTVDENGTEVAPIVPVVNSIGTKTTRQLFGFNSEIEVPCWDYTGQLDQLDPHYYFDKIKTSIWLAYYLAGETCWLYGEAGTGKTTFLEQFCIRVGRPFVTINMDARVEPNDLFGSMGIADGTSFYAEGSVPQAMATPVCMLILDEVTTAPDGTLTAMNSLFDTRRSITIKETGKVFRATDGFMAVSVDNTNGNGDDTGLYTATGVVNKAFRDRHGAYIRFDYMSQSREAKLISKLSGLDFERSDKLAAFATLSRESARQGNIREAVGFRALVAIAKQIKQGIIDATTAFENTVLNGLTADDQEETMRQLANTNFDL